MSKHTVRFSDPVDIEIEVDEDETILDAALNQGLRLYYACKEGQCAACKNFCIDGEVDHDPYSNFALSDAELEDGFVLLCKAFPFSDCEIEILHWDEDMRDGGIPIREFQTKVDRIESLTHDLRRLTLQLVDPPEMVFYPGQYVDIHVPAKDGEGAYKRSFSMACTPAAGDRLEFIIKALPDGRFSGLLEGELAPGDPLMIKGPYGMFLQRTRSERDIIMVGGGAGISALWALLQSFDEQQLDRDITFYYGARTRGDLCLKEDVEELGERLENFEYVPALSEEAPDTDWLGETGLITEVLDRREGDLSDRDAYLCGPPPMIDAVIPLLVAKGIPEDRIFFDKFTTTASEDEK